MNSLVANRDAQPLEGGVGAAMEPAAVKAAGRPRLSLKKLAFVSAVVAVAAGATWYGHDWWTLGRFLRTTDDAYVGADVITIAPNVGGLVTSVPVNDNQVVHAGDLLVKIDDRDYRATLAKAQAAVASQQATLANLEATRRLQLTAIAQAQAGIAGTDAEVVRSGYDQVRYQQLSATGAVPEEAFQKADATYKEAVASSQRATATREAARRQIDVIDTQKRQVEAALAGAIADRDRAQLDVDYTEVRAPIDGTIGNRSARVGGYATVGAQLLSIVPASALWIDANFKESQLAGMHEGLPVTIEADVLPGETFHGHVSSLAPATGAQFSVLPASNATGNFTKIVQRVPVRIVLDGEASVFGRLRPGLSVTADVDERPSASTATASSLSLGPR